MDLFDSLVFVYVFFFFLLTALEAGISFQCEMLRNFHRSVSSLLTIRSSLLTRPKDSRVLYFWNSPVKLNSSDNKDDRDGGTYLDYKGKIPLDKLSVKFARSSGPGGQNVNKGLVKFCQIA